MIGDVLDGFCGGFFGRDSYCDKRIEGEGRDWIVAREEVTQTLCFATFDNEIQKESLIETYRKKGP